MTGFSHGIILSAGIGRAAPASPWAGNLCRRGLPVRFRLIRDNRPAAGAPARAMLEASILAGRDNAAAVEAAPFFSPRQVKPEERGEMIVDYPADEQRSITGAAFRHQVLCHAKGLKETGVLKPSTDPARFTDRITVDRLGSYCPASLIMLGRASSVSPGHRPW